MDIEVACAPNPNPNRTEPNRTESMASLEIERQASNRAPAQDEDRLAQFGYKQELNRDWVCSFVPALHFLFSYLMVTFVLRVRPADVMPTVGSIAQLRHLVFYYSKSGGSSEKKGMRRAED